VQERKPSEMMVMLEIERALERKKLKRVSALLKA
jgi:hypothetical protein